MTAVGALVVGLILLIALGALVAVLTGVPILAIIVGAGLTGGLAFYLITNRLMAKALKKPPTSASNTAIPETRPMGAAEVALPEKDHIS